MYNFKKVFKQFISFLDAFKRARMKMMQAREAATRELLKDIEKRK